METGSVIFFIVFINEVQSDYSVLSGEGKGDEEEEEGEGEGEEEEEEEEEVVRERARQESQRGRKEGRRKAQFYFDWGRQRM